LLHISDGFQVRACGQYVHVTARMLQSGYGVSESSSAVDICKENYYFGSFSWYIAFVIAKT